MPLRYGGLTSPVCAHDVQIFNKEGNEAGVNELGDMVLKLPLPPGSLMTLYKNDARFVKEYLEKFPGYYDTMDCAFRDEDGYIHIVGRVDDVINVSGHRLSTGAMEECLMNHPEVADCAVFPVKDDVKGQIPVGLVILNKGSTATEDSLRAELIALVRDEIGPVAAFKKVASVKALPKVGNSTVSLERHISPRSPLISLFRRLIDTQRKDSPRNHVEDWKRRRVQDYTNNRGPKDIRIPGSSD